MIEHWKKIENTPYKVSNTGKVITTNYKCSGETKELKQATNHKGYKVVGLSIDGKEKKFLVHRLVAEAFIPNPNNLPQVNHIDEDKTNNRVDNLEWCTNDYNIRYSQCKAIIGIDIDTLDYAMYDGCRDAEDKDGYLHSNISAVIKGKRKTTGNKYWYYLPPTVDEYFNVKNGIYSIDATNSEIVFYDSITDAAKCTDVCASTISRCLNGKLKTAGKKYWCKV